MGPNLGANVELSIEKKALRSRSPKSKVRALIWDVKLLLANAQTVQLVIISKMTACKLEVQNVIPSRKDAVQFKAPFGRAPAGSGSCTVARCRPAHAL